MTPDWRNTLLITGASLAIGAGYLLLPNDDAVLTSVNQGYQVVYQCRDDCPTRLADGVSWPVLPLSLGLGAAASGGLAWHRARRAAVRREDQSTGPG
ncbi:hypothetical protein [Actinokineospora iranica]|uniref:Uncharacterized protein n=1 Tax=Actinokineospora iranica TaxID=1271860 RepID=A0A1G6VAE0_9PSEU|nr:hypothetical protein [Actinokineospora iranica]SDD50471.1 hypothetical protein SAMN05216174_11220 [Actinokineospora iranica]